MRFFICNEFIKLFWEEKYRSMKTKKLSKMLTIGLAFVLAFSLIAAALPAGAAGRAGPAGPVPLGAPAAGTAAAPGLRGPA
jgi:hypothetical protein